MSMIRSIVLAVIAAVTLCIDSSRSDAPPAKPPAKPAVPRLPTGHELMVAKMKASHRVLEGIALSDYKRLKAGADELVRIAAAAEFMTAYKSEEYVVRLNDFRRAAQSVAKAAKEENLDGATLAYLDMTLSCVKCHRLTRDKPDARLPLKTRDLANK